MGEMVELRLTRHQFMALYSLVLDRVMEHDKVRLWENIVTEETVTIDDLLSLLSIKV